MELATEEVKIARPGRTEMGAFVARPREASRAPAVLVIPGFFNDTRHVYSRDAATDAWRRTLDFFDEHLRAPAAQRRQS